MRNLIRLAIVFAAVIVFFLGYNTFLLDRSLETLKYSLDAVARAKTAEAATDVGMLLDYNVVREIAAHKIDPARLANLEYTKSVLTKGEAHRKLEDVEFVLTELVAAKSKERGKFLGSLDEATLVFVATTNRVIYLPFSYRAKKKVSAADLALLDEAKGHEEKWNFADAASSYKRFISKYPYSEKIGSAKLRLGFSYQKLGRLDDAQRLYLEVARAFSGKSEGQLATRLLDQLRQAKALSARKRELLRAIKGQLLSTPELQEAYYNMGLVNIELSEFEAAYESFSEAAALDPESERAYKSKFAQAWLFKYQKKFEEASRSFEEVVQGKPGLEVLISAKYELADLNRDKGAYEKAIAGYREIAQAYADMAIAPLAQYQIGTTYFYDLGDTEAASQAFKELKEKYPTSAYVIKGIDNLEEFTSKEEMLSADYHPIMISWIDKIMPDSSARFAQRTTEFARGLAERQIREFSATYTDEELNFFLARRFSQILPEQVAACAFAVKKDHLLARGDLRLRLLPFSFRAKGRLILADKRPQVALDELIINELPIPKVLLDESARQINLALKSEYFPLEFDEVIQEEGRLSVKGRLKFSSP